nr:uncharacterized protein LOC123282693 [Equus asinus]
MAPPEMKPPAPPAFPTPFSTIWGVFCVSMVIRYTQLSTHTLLHPHARTHAQRHIHTERLKNRNPAARSLASKLVVAVGFYQLCLSEVQRQRYIHGKGGGTWLDQNPCDLRQSFIVVLHRAESACPPPSHHPSPNWEALTQSVASVSGSSSPAKAIACEGKVLRLEGPRWGRAGGLPGKARGPRGAPSASIPDPDRCGALSAPQTDLLRPAPPPNPSQTPGSAMWKPAQVPQFREGEQKASKSPLLFRASLQTQSACLFCLPILGTLPPEKNFHIYIYMCVYIYKIYTHTYIYVYTYTYNHQYYHQQLSPLYPLLSLQIWDGVGGWVGISPPPPPSLPSLF